MPEAKAPYHPIIYVRGYAMTPTEIDETTADPFCGFNLGSTVYRASPDKERRPRKYVFESPVVRLASDFGYRDVYEDGCDILDPDWNVDGARMLGSRSIIIYRYYDEASRLLGLGETPPIEEFSRRLGELILKVRELVCANPDNGVEPDSFRCYLVAHSMGGLVCRGLLQNPANDPHDARRHVDKLFTYATPHNGIEMAGINIPSWLSTADMDNFNRKRMAGYLDLKDALQRTGRVDWIPDDRFPPARVFCMVGTNRLDYEVAFGASRTFSGHGGDGLVRIENATLAGMHPDGTPGMACAKAFAYRSHSGFFGIVNSEEAYQNLIRFLFGDVRVDIWVEIDEIRLPVKVQKAAEEGRQVNALYQIEVLAAPRGKLWYLTRRTAEEDSVACFSHEEWVAPGARRPRRIFLSSVFLANRARVNPDRRSLAYAMSLGVRAPDYEIERKLWPDEHYEGGYLFRDSLVLEIEPPTGPGEPWNVRHAWQEKGSRAADTRVDTKDLAGGRVDVSVPFDSGTTPGMQGRLHFIVSAWNPAPATSS